MCCWIQRVFSALVLISAISCDPNNAAAATAPACVDNADASGLTQLFDRGLNGLSGADYQRAFALPDGRILWVFQDAFLHRPSGQDALVHNIGIVQTANCFSLLRSGTAQRPTSWVGAAATTDRLRWFWPLGGTVIDHQRFVLFFAEFRESGATYLSQAHPVATWIATIDLKSMTPSSFHPAANPTAALYGWAVASDDNHTYLYAHCYRQFGYGYLGHDTCTANVTIARAPRGNLDGPFQYWTGTIWSDNPNTAVNIAPLTGPRGEPRAINPMQIARLNNHWISVTKEGDWWGTKIYIDTAAAPTGPWTTIDVLNADTLGSTNEYNTYFASLIPTTQGHLLIGLSNNRWDGQQSHNYRPTFRDLPPIASRTSERQPPNSQPHARRFPR
jgi:hypothetical protein